MDILVIESNARRRVTTAKHLARAGHRMTISSSVGEAREVLQFVQGSAGAPDAVVIAEGLASADRGRFREDLRDRFPDVCWIALPPELSLDWLEGWLTKSAARASRHASNVVPFPGQVLGARSQSRVHHWDKPFDSTHIRRNRHVGRRPT
jgi:hypothetical protein